MKKRGIVILLLLLILCVPGAFAIYAWNYMFDPKCQLCWEGFSTNGSLQIFNIGDQPFRVLKVMLKDASGIDFFSSPSETTIDVGGSATFNFQFLLPPPTRGFTLFYKPCLLLPNGEMCADGHSRMLIKPLSELECFNDESCAGDETCVVNKCRGIVCNGQAMDHTCYSPSDNSQVWIIASIAIVLFGIVIWLLLRRRRGTGLNLRL